ncbi:hypothetical protein E0K83_07715 [Gramella sp. BOM4]|nr:hypothetical protein [Christiangramia bathymodioli]
MNFQAPISILLSLMLLAKIFLVEASFMQLLSGGEIRIEKAYCKKKNSISENNKAVNFAAETGADSQQYEFLSSCTPQLNFSIAAWQVILKKPVSSIDEFYTYRLDNLYLDQHSPPPKSY